MRQAADRGSRGQPILEMRYDGVARRSQKENPGIIDRVWNFFSSVKVAIYLILLTLIGSSLGTIFPQESTFLNIDPSVYYKEEYGLTGAYLLLARAVPYIHVMVVRAAACHDRRIACHLQSGPGPSTVQSAQQTADSEAYVLPYPPKGGIPRTSRRGRSRLG